MRTLRHTLVLGSALVLAACGGGEPQAPRESVRQTGAPLLKVGEGAAIPGEYIVLLKDGADPAAVAAETGLKPRYLYKATLKGFALKLDAAQLEAVRSHPQVQLVEEDATVTAAATQTGATWGIDRIDQRALPLSGTYNYTATASNVRVYIIDTGLLAPHTQFGGRASNVYDVTGGNGTDCQGHGTHVGGTVGGSTYGVAKGVGLRGVRVLDCQGSGTISGIIAALDWLRANAQRPAVAVMGLNGAYSATLNAALANVVNSGIFMAVAAGNDSADACTYSPASTPVATTVAATNSRDCYATYSNYGSCVDLYAPGSSITSAGITTLGATQTLSGTSMAAAHVAGVAALYKGTYGDASQSTIDTWLKTNATLGIVCNNPPGTPNLLLYKGAL
jgi:subtilisin family serine protease